jgi:hypothetical protein
MILTYEHLLKSMQDQMLTAMTNWQQGTLEAYHAWIKATSHMFPEINFYHEMPTFMENTFEFAIKIMELQKEFVQEVFDASNMAPLTPLVPRRGVEPRIPASLD